MPVDLHVGDVGTSIELTVTETNLPMNIANASVKQIKLRKPNGAVVTKPAAFVTNGTDGKLCYVTVQGDLDASGLWRAQAYLETPSWSGHTSRITFSVGPAFS